MYTIDLIELDNDDGTEVSELIFNAVDLIEERLAGLEMDRVRLKDIQDAVFRLGLVAHKLNDLPDELRIMTKRGGNA